VYRLLLPEARARSVASAGAGAVLLAPAFLLLALFAPVWRPVLVASGRSRAEEHVQDRDRHQSHHERHVEDRHEVQRGVLLSDANPFRRFYPLECQLIPSLAKTNPVGVPYEEGERSGEDAGYKTGYIAREDRAEGSSEQS
jgi:hypothetical protein